MSKGVARLIKDEFRIVSSPFLRARETAEILSEVTGAVDPVMFSETLQPEREPEEFLDVLKHQETPIVVSVGHEPHLSALASQLVFNDPTPYKIKLKKAGAMAIRVGLTSGFETEFLWLMTPKQLARGAN